MFFWQHMLQFQAILCRNKKHTSDCFGESGANLGLCSWSCPDARRNNRQKNRYVELARQLNYRASDVRSLDSVDSGGSIPPLLFFTAATFKI